MQQRFDAAPEQSAPHDDVGAQLDLAPRLRGDADQGDHTH
jgi:hypothetical protein